MNRPITWLKSVDSEKIFGIFLTNSYSEILNVNWNFRLEKFRKAIILSGSSIWFISLKQRVEVVKMFALSRIYYVASILPIRKGVMKKMESLIGNFIWAGHGVISITVTDLKNSQSCGGLGLPCIDMMNKALMTSQCVRLLKSTDTKSMSHIDFWMGSLLVNIFPRVGNFALDMDTPEYFSHIGE